MIGRLLNWPPTGSIQAQQTGAITDNWDSLCGNTQIRGLSPYCCREVWYFFERGSLPDLSVYSTFPGSSDDHTMSKISGSIVGRTPFEYG